MKIALEQVLEEKDCSCAAYECWSAFPKMLGVYPCVAVGECAGDGYALSCETDINGALTMVLLNACNLYKEPSFLADLTIRNPNDDNSELLWHCGPFSYVLKDPESEALLVEGQQSFKLKDGHLSLCRLSDDPDCDGKYRIFVGEADTTDGPETMNTYVYIKVDNWKRWEERIVFGPYIHHVGAVYGNLKPVLREIARYMDIIFDDADEQGVYSL